MTTVLLVVVVVVCVRVYCVSSAITNGTRVTVRAIRLGAILVHLR